jgi:hypothetical protein
MAKSIKKSFKYLIIALGVLLMVPGVLYPLLQLSAVQTYIGNRVSSHIFKGLNSTISIGKIDYRFFNKLAINDILIRDQHNDTLLYTSEIVAGIRRFDLDKKIIRLGKISLVKPVIGLISDSAGVMNLDYFLKQLQNPGDTASKKPFSLSIEQIELNDARLSFIDKSATKGKSQIDFANLHFSDINTIIEDFRVRDDTITFDIYKLGFMEGSGFALKRMSSSVKLASGIIEVGSLSLNTDSSVLNFSKIGLKADSSGSFKNFTTGVKLDVVMDKSLLATSDIGYFLPPLKGVNESLWLSGKFLGTVSELRGRNILLSYRNNTVLDCDFDLSGLPNIDNTFIYIGVNSLTTNATDIEKIRVNGKQAVLMPDAAYKLGTISFDGSFTGFTTDFVTYGELSTSQGRIRTDISLRPEKSNRYTFKGTVIGSDIKLGELTAEPEMYGNLSFHASVDGYAFSLRKFSASLTGNIDSIGFNKYLYRDVTLNGIFTDKTWDGSINISDRNIKMDLLGMFDFSNKLPEFDFTLNLAHANLFNLNLDKVDSTSSASMLMTANFKGNNIDNLDGEIKLLNSSFVKYGNTLELYNFSVKSFKENNVPALRLRTDYVDADLKGNYNFAVLGKLLKSSVSVILPPGSRTTMLKSDLKKNNFTFNINFKNTNKLNSFLHTGILIADKSYIKGSVSQDTLMNVEVRSSSFNLKNNIFSDMAIYGTISGPRLAFKLRSSSLNLLMQSELKDFSIDFNTKPDNFVFAVDWDNNEKILNSGNFTARGNLLPNPLKKGASILTIGIDSSNIYARNNLWKIGKSTIIIDSNAVAIKKFYLRNQENYYLVDGSVSAKPSDTLKLEFKGIDISPINYIGNQETSDDSDKTSFDFKGKLNGKIQLSNIYKNLLMESNINIDNFSVLGDDLGTLSVASELDISKNLLNIRVSNDLNGLKMIDINGYYDPSSKVANLTGLTNKLPITFLNPLLKTFASGISGTASGKVNLSLPHGNVILTGSVFAENANLKIDYLQARFKLNDTIRFDKNGISFANLKVADEKGNPVSVNGRVNHKNFKDFSVDLAINTKNALVLNTKQRDNDLFHGTAYATGVTTIKSKDDILSFDISGRTDKNTKFIMPLNSSQSVSEYSFITFANSKIKKAGTNDTDESHSKPVSSSTGLDLNFDLEVTPEAEAQLVFDSKVGDIMKGHGSGNLNITLDPQGNFKITGDYIVEDGDYLFTLGNILNKSFRVENGGKIMFNGDINNAEIDIKAIYKLKASLFPILQDENYKDRIPVECQLNLSGNLWNPVVGFNIYLPTADEKTRTYVRNAISTEEELSRQILYLLVMNSFYADPSMGVASTGSSPSGTSAMAVTTFEMLSNQLSNWLSQISNDFDIGVVYRPGSGNKEINPQEVQVALSTQIFNEKVVINGNFDVPLSGNGSSENTSSGTNQITGDFDADIKLTNKLNFKVFNRYNNPYTGKGVDYTQGIGIFYKQDFDRLSDLFRKKLKKDTKKADKNVSK